MEIARRSVEAFNERDVPTLQSLFTGDCVLRLIGGFAAVMGTEFRGEEAVLGWMRDIVEAIGGTAEVDEFHEVGDRVLLIVRARASGAASQAEVTLRFGNLYSFRDGKISALDSYYAVEEALKAVGWRSRRLAGERGSGWVAAKRSREAAPTKPQFVGSWGSGSVRQTPLPGRPGHPMRYAPPYGRQCSLVVTTTAW